MAAKKRFKKKPAKKSKKARKKQGIPIGETLSLPEEFNDWARLQQTEYVAVEYLKKHDHTSEGEAISNSELFNGVSGLFPEHGIPEATFKVCLSILVRSNQSVINNKGRHQGYYLLSVETLESTKDVESAEPVAENSREQRNRREREKLLYPIFTQWLLTQGYSKVKDTSTSRNQDLGVWGNPDISGYKIHEVIGKTEDIEFATIEVKLSIDNWKQFIFEAVAHKRLSNRAYFAFAHLDEAISKVDPDIRHYAEIYGIGILILPMSATDIAGLVKGGDKKSLAEYSPADIIEYHSAEYERTHYHFRDRFLKAIGVNSESALHDWGDKIE